MIDKELVRLIVKQRQTHKEWICTRHDACTCDGIVCIYPCTCYMKKKSNSIDPLHNPAPNCACDFCRDLKVEVDAPTKRTMGQ